MGKCSNSNSTASIALLSLIILCGVSYLETIKLGFCLSDLDHDVARCLDMEKKALIKFKQALTEPSSRLSSWVGEDCCKWRGVSCNNRTRHVVKLKLRNPFSYGDERAMMYALSGEINPSLLALKDLSYLDLSMNDFGGAQIPSFIGSLEKLRYLNLSGASFGGVIPPSLGNLSRLSYLDLDLIDYNAQSEKSDDLQWISGLTSLKYLNLGGWDLTKASSYWFQTVTKLPSLLELHLPNCKLSHLSLSFQAIKNFTSLSVLDLSNNDFKSKIPYWLFNLTTLSHLNLNSNKFYGALPPAISNLASLQMLGLSGNNIGGQLPRTLGRLCNLQTMQLSGNELTGEITDFIDSLSECSTSSLQTLDLEYNELTGNLPESIGCLKNLKYLSLGSNSFQGSIPESIQNLTSVEEILLSDNQMRGEIPVGLGQLSRLVVFDISDNTWEGIITEAHLANLSSLKDVILTNKQSPNISLVFNISSDWVPKFKLRYLEIRSCQVGPNFPTWLKDQKELTNVVLNNARISDTIPSWFWQLGLELDELDVALNRLRGKVVPKSIRFRYPGTVDLGSNLFEGPLPLWSSNVTMLNLGGNNFSGPIPSAISEVMPNLVALGTSMNPLGGSIPLSIGNLTSLTTLVLSNNKLSGEIPHSIWENKPFLNILDMSSNNLSGTIPTSMGSLTALGFLVLSNNNLSGEIPSSLRNCSGMAILDFGDNKLSGHLPSWIGENMSSLLIFQLRSNFFSGNLPSQFCRLSNIHILDLSHNNLSGQIPHCFGNLRGMKSELTEEDKSRYLGLVLDGNVIQYYSALYTIRMEVVAKGSVLQYSSTLYLVKCLDLSDNKLTGEIPMEMTSLLKLGTLNLSRNHLNGRIPLQIGKLERLETLDLSSNNLSGPIPQGMSSLTFLNHLNLSYNNLSGEIPTANQFQTLNDASIYQGNAGLCGYPLPNDCPGSSRNPRIQGGDREENGRDDDNDDDKDDASEKLGFFISMVIGFILGFWAVFGSLVINKSWRIAYFHFVDKMKDRTYYFFWSMIFRRNN